MKVSLLVKIILFIIRVVLAALPVFLFGWLVYKDLVVSGELVAGFDVKNLSPFITTLRPNDRVSEPKKLNEIWYQQIINQPVYFDVRLPRHFDSAKIKLVYQNLDQPIFQLGALVDFDRWLFDLKPVDNEILNFLYSDKFHWSRVNSGNITLFQKNLNYNSVEDFLKNFPPLNSVAVYNYELDYDFKIPGYSPAPGGLAVNKSLRGEHRLYTYLENEPLNYTFLIQDVNRHLGDDYLSIEIYNKKNELIYSKFIADDGNATDNLKMFDVKEINVVIDDLPPGVYKVELITPSDDIFIRKIKTEQDYLVFINQIYLADDSGYVDENSLERSGPTFIWTDGHIISAETVHLEGLQEIAVGGQMLNIAETHKNFLLEAPYGLKPIVIPSSDLRLSTKGLFSFSRESYFKPTLSTLADGADFDRDQIDYVVASYNLPDRRPDGWQVAEIDFDVNKYYTADDRLHFVLSLPYFQSGERGINLAEIQVDLRRRPLLWNDIIKKIKTVLKPR